MISIKISIYKLFVIGLFSVFLYGCPVFSEKTIVDNGPLPDSAKLVVPYKNGEDYKFKFSNGLVINFTAEREIVDAIDNGCAECFNFEQHYQRDIIKLIPDYPLFDISFEINNLDTTEISCDLVIGNNYYYIPTNEQKTSYIEQFDSLLIDSVFYKNVFKLYPNYFNNKQTLTDSLYYNYKFGILKLIKSNNETYTILP